MRQRDQPFGHRRRHAAIDRSDHRPRYARRRPRRRAGTSARTASNSSARNAGVVTLDPRRCSPRFRVSTWRAASLAAASRASTSPSGPGLRPATRHRSSATRHEPLVSHESDSAADSHAANGAGPWRSSSDRRSHSSAFSSLAQVATAFTSTSPRAHTAHQSRASSAGASASLPSETATGRSPAKFAAMEPAVSANEGPGFAGRARDLDGAASVLVRLRCRSPELCVRELRHGHRVLGARRIGGRKPCGVLHLVHVDEGQPAHESQVHAAHAELRRDQRLGVGIDPLEQHLHGIELVSCGPGVRRGAPEASEQVVERYVGPGRDGTRAPLHGGATAAPPLGPDASPTAAAARSAESSPCTGLPVPNRRSAMATADATGTGCSLRSSSTSANRRCHLAASSSPGRRQDLGVHGW